MARALSALVTGSVPSPTRIAPSLPGATISEPTHVLNCKSCILIGIFARSLPGLNVEVLKYLRVRLWPSACSFRTRLRVTCTNWDFARWSRKRLRRLSKHARLDDLVRIDGPGGRGSGIHRDASGIVLPHCRCIFLAAVFPSRFGPRGSPAGSMNCAGRSL